MFGSPRPFPQVYVAAAMTSAASQQPLADKILVAFDLACQQRDLEVAQHLHRCLELLLSKPPTPDDRNHRAAIEAAMVAYDKLVELKGP